MTRAATHNGTATITGGAPARPAAAGVFRRPRVTFLDAGSLPEPLSFDGGPDVVYEPHDATPGDAVDARIRDAEVVITNKVALTAGHLAQARRLELICVAGAGIDHVDAAAARRMRIDVVNVPDYAAESVAEHVVGALLALRRSTAVYARAAVDGRWSAARQFCWHGPAIRSLDGSLLGLVGRGRIGEATARRARALGMRVVFAAKPGETPAADELGLDAMFAAADAISLHVPLTGANRHLVDRRRLASMQATAVLVNTARGGLVDSAALACALREGRIAGAALDVLDVEPPPPTHPLLAVDIPNLLLTPHVAWAADTARRALALRLSDTIRGHFASRVQALAA